MLLQSTAGQFVAAYAVGSATAYQIIKADGTLVDPGGGSITALTKGNSFKVSPLSTELDQLGPVTIIISDNVNALGQVNETVLAALPAVPANCLDAAGVRAAVGLAAANLDTQLAALTPLTAAGVRAAVGLAAANLDTQLAALTPLTAAGVRAAVGLAAANLDTQLAAILAASGGLDAAGVRAAVGLAAANLDTQLAALSTLNPADVRAAVGLAAANLDTQLAAIGAPLTPAGVRSALGMAAANMDQQFDAVRPTGTAPAAIREALGVAQPNLDEEITARNEALETLLQRFPSPETTVIGSRR